MFAPPALNTRARTNSKLPVPATAHEKSHTNEFRYPPKLSGPVHPAKSKVVGKVAEEQANSEDSGGATVQSPILPTARNAGSSPGVEVEQVPASETDELSSAPVNYPAPILSEGKKSSVGDKGPAVESTSTVDTSVIPELQVDPSHTDSTSVGPIQTPETTTSTTDSLTSTASSTPLPVGASPDASHQRDTVMSLNNGEDEDSDTSESFHEHRVPSCVTAPRPQSIYHGLTQSSKEKKSSFLSPSSTSESLNRNSISKSLSKAALNRAPQTSKPLMDPMNRLQFELQRRNDAIGEKLARINELRPEEQIALYSDISKAALRFTERINNEILVKGRKRMGLQESLVWIGNELPIPSFNWENRVSALISVCALAAVVFYAVMCLMQKPEYPAWEKYRRQS